MVHSGDPERDANLHLPVVSKIYKEVSLKRARLSEFFKDYDPLRRGECNPSGLNCAMTQVNIRLSEDEFEKLHEAYIDPNNGKFCFRKFLNDVEEAGEIAVLEEEKEHHAHLVAKTPKTRLKSTKHVWKSCAISVLTMLQAQVYERRVSFRDFFHDFDKLRKGFVSESNLRCVLSLLNFEVTEEAIGELVRLYGVVGEGKNLDYRKLCHDVEAALVCPPLENDPSGMPPSPFDLFAAKEGQKAILTDSEIEAIKEVEQHIRRKTQQRGVYFLSHFRAYDKYNRLVITGNQFYRVMATLGFDISQQELDVLLKKYCIGGSANRFAYREFCASIDS